RPRTLPAFVVVLSLPWGSPGSRWPAPWPAGCVIDPGGPLGPPGVRLSTLWAFRCLSCFTQFDSTNAIPPQT
ncbi:unnamed protein product, partial [Amoebophrya sp. A120]